MSEKRVKTHERKVRLNLFYNKKPLYSSVAVLVD